MNIFHVSSTFFWTAYFVSNLLAILLLIGSRQHPGLTRIFFLLLFLAASIINAHVAQDSPWAYQDYADTALPLYKKFILGAFEAIITPMVLCIAAVQLLIAISMILKGKLFQIGCWAGIIFLVCISPLGFNAAFPSTLIMAASLFVLQKKSFETYVWQQKQYKVHTT